MMSIKQLIAKIKEIENMGFNELVEFKRKVSMSNIDETDPKAAWYLHQAIEVRELELRNREDATVENGEMKSGEVG